MEPIYISSIIVGQSQFDSEKIVGDHLRRSLYERIIPLSNNLTKPFKVNKVMQCTVSPVSHMSVEYNSKLYFIFILQPCFHVAPVPPKDFQHCETALETLTCGWEF